MRVQKNFENKVTFQKISCILWSWIFLFLCTYANAQVQSFCKCDNNIIKNQGLCDSEQVLERAQGNNQNPFLYACQNQPLKITSGFLQRKIPKQDQTGVPTLDLLDRILTRVEDENKENAQRIAGLFSCFSDDGRLRTTPTYQFNYDNPIRPLITRDDSSIFANSGFHKLNSKEQECEKWKKHLEITIPERARDARINLALAHTFSTLKNIFEQKESSDRLQKLATQVRIRPNTQLDTLGTFKAMPWEGLSSEETERASELLKKDQRLASTITNLSDELLKRESGVGFDDRSKKLRTSLELLKIQIRRGNTYLARMDEFPVLQLIKSARPSKTEVLAGYRTIQENVSREGKDLKTLRRLYLTAKQTGGEIPSELLELTKYSAQLEEELLANPKQCSLAAEILKIRQNLDLQSSLIVGGIAVTGTIASAILFPPSVAFWVSLGGGATLSSTEVADLYYERQKRLQRYLASPTENRLYQADQSPQSYSQLKSTEEVDDRAALTRINDDNGTTLIPDARLRLALETANDELRLGLATSIIATAAGGPSAKYASKAARLLRPQPK